MRMMSISDAKNVKHITDTVELLERRAAKARAEGDVEQAEKHEEALQAFKLELLQKQAQLSEHYTGMQELMLKHGIRPYAHYGVDASLEKSLK
jgi:CCR4-NOT transcriptional regulation complex NOT5 subunit